MRQSIRERVLKVAAYIAEHQGTVRAAAAFFDVSKSTVHSDMTVRLPALSAELYKKVKVIMEKNREERHLRGGESTKQKYRIMRL